MRICLEEICMYVMAQEGKRGYLAIPVSLISITNMPFFFFFFFELQSCVGNKQTITNTNVVANNPAICENKAATILWQ